MHVMERKMQDKPYPQRRRTPSFSSSLLDAIYRSIDESKSNLDEDPQLGFFNQTTHNSKHNNNLSYKFNYNHGVYVNKEKLNHHRAVMIEDWMEKQSSKSSQFINSTTSSSSESSYGAVFSSSETDTTHKPRHQKRNSEKNQQKQKPQREGGFARTKLGALKIYGELNQKVKQPISPGSRIASFLSSIFNSAGNVKKAKKMCYVGAVEDASFENKYSKSSSSPCFSSSASSFSRRSCMSKTPGKCSNNGVKRSVRFYPVSVILGEEDSHPSLLPLSSSVRKMTRSSSIKEVKKNSKENGAEAAARGFIKGYQNSDKGGKFGFIGFHGNGEDECNEEDDDDEDALSYSSSDLFELDHLIGAAGRYQEELPVYETTNLETNMAIANGLRL